MWSVYLKWQADFHAILDERFYTGPWLDMEVWSGRIALLYRDDAAALVTVKTFPTGAKEAHGMAAVGNLGTILRDIIPAFENWGKAMGCTVATIESREGWKRVLKGAGYAPHQIALRKELNNGS